MTDVFQYPTYKTFTCEVDNKRIGSCVSENVVSAWMLYGKLPQNIFVTPTYRNREIIADGANRYLQSVTVNAIPVTNITVALAAAAVMTITNLSAVSAVSSDEATATVEVVNGVITITGVAAGTSTITVKDVNSDIIYIIEVTVA